MSSRPSPKLRARGVTLFEVLIVVALMALLAGATLFGSGMLGSSRLRGAATLIGSAVRLGLARANTSGRPTRLVLDLDGERILLEEATSSRMLREKDDKAGGAEAATEAEKAARNESDRILDGPRARRPTFIPVSSFSETEGGRDLGGGIDLHQVQTDRDSEPISEGRAYLYFWPGGVTERAHVAVRQAGAGEGLTVIVSALTGRTTIQRGAVALPEPRSDREEDQGEREAP